MATTDDLEIIWAKPRSFLGGDHPGIRLNNLTTTQRDALTGSGAPKTGHVIFNTTTGQIEIYDGTNWVTHFAVDNLSVAGELTIDGATGTGADTAGVLRLETAETTVVNNDQLGRIDFRAPAETGADAILVSASFWAEAKATFDATTNTTDFVWALGTSEVAAEKMRLTPAAALTLASGGTFNIGSANMSEADLEQLDGLTAGTATASKALVVDAAKTISGLGGVQLEATARTATADGTGTGTIATGTGFVTVTSANAAHIIKLPDPTPGVVVRLMNGGTGYELQASAQASVAINGGTGAAVSSSIAAATYVEARCVTATAWIANQYAADGTESKVEAAN
jgi:hypothetical protein